MLGMDIEMRVFFAIEFEEELKEYLYNIQEEIRQYCMAGKFTSKENFHLTLRFIGEQTPIQITQLITALKESASAVSAIELILNNLGKFDKGNKKIIWVGLKKNQELEALYSKLETSLVKYEYQKEDRGFSPHITLAREVKIEDFDEVANNIAINNLTFKVKSISLMESKRIDNKLCYVPIASEKF